MDISRRQAIGGVAAGAAALASPGTAAAADNPEDYRTEVEPGVYLVYDEAELLTLEPYLKTAHLDHQPAKVAGWIATTGSENLDETGAEDTNIAEFWVEYHTQSGVSPWDSHLGDHEPIYVEYEPTPSGPEIHRILYSGYHWITARTAAPPTAEDGAGNPHPTLMVNKPYHHYFTTTETGRFLSDDVGMSNLHSHLQGWLDNGWPVHVPAVLNPWVMSWRGSWWERGAFGISAAETFYRATHGAGLFGAEGSDL